MALPAAVPGQPVSDDERRALRRALGAFATGVTVVTTRAADGAPVGLTVNSFASVSLNPPLVSWCLTETALSMPAFRTASHFAVNVLAADQVHLVHHFAQRTLDKFQTVTSVPGLGGAPLLGGVAARYECRTTAIHPGGDHVIFLGQVERFERFDVEPLVFLGGRFGRLAES